MNNTLRLITAGGLLAAGLPLTAMGQTITVTATVASQCNIGNGTVALGSLNLLSGGITKYRQQHRPDLQQGGHRCRSVE